VMPGRSRLCSGDCCNFPEVEMMTKCSFKRPFVLDVGDQQSGRERPRVQGAGSGSAPKRGSLTPRLLPLQQQRQRHGRRRTPSTSHQP